MGGGQPEIFGDFFWSSEQKFRFLRKIQFFTKNLLLKSLF
jgi:hypothetical protein